MHSQIRSVFALALALSGCGAADTIGQTDEASETGMVTGPERAHIHYQKGYGKPGGGGGGNLIDHGGLVLPTSHSVAIWWGDPTQFPSDAKTGLNALLSGFGGSAFLNIEKQYMHGASVASSFVTNYVDTSAPPSRAPATSTIVGEACNIINANHLTADTSAIYFVFTSNFPGRTSYCAWHSYGTCNGVTIQVAYMPNTTGMAGCDPGDLYGCNNYSQGTRSIANVTSHEFAEAITDANASAWYDSSGAENGDKCAWTFSSCVSLSTGSWQLQREWSNAISGCQQ